jgi:hypothetical protein
MHAPARPVRFVVAISALAAALPLLAETDEVPYPNGYRQWTHVKTMQILPGHPLYAAFGGVHHLFANAKAMGGYRSGTFPDGSVIAFDLYDANTADHTVTDGAHKVLGVMHKDAKRYAATGGWGFEAWKAGDPTQRAVNGDAATACFGCHAPQKAHDYVFSTYRR